MKHRLLSLLLAGSLAMSGFSAVPYVLNESFESGIPASWSQDVMNSLGGEWRVDTLATNPAGAYDGEKRVALRALGGNVGYCVRLVTPELDLSQVNNPQLSFAFAQVRRAGAYQDTLSVYFRSSSASEWIMIRKYSDQQVGWSHQVLDLPALAKSPTCQFAFEAKENGGYGVVLDLVRVYPKSQCADVVLAAPTVGSNAARINWSANPRLFEVILSATAIADLANYDTSAAVYHANNLSGTTGGVTITNLDPQTHYFVYVRTDCDDNESGHTAWVSTDFTTTIGIPFTPVLASIPSAWEQKKGDAAATVLSSALSDNTTSYKWQSTSNTAVSGSAHLYAQSAGTPSWLLTQAIDLSNRAEESTVLLSFRLALTASATATTASTEAASTKFHVYASAGDGDSWQLVRTIEGSEISNTGSSYNVTLDDYLETGAVRLAFVADAQSSSAYIHLSDVNLAESDGLCLGLYGLKPSVAPNSITLSWSKIGLSATEVMLSDVADFSHILQQQTVSGITHTFNGLNTSETYFVKVRQDCENGDSLTLQLKTPCFPSTITAENPYTEGFEAYTGKAYNATDGVSPDCWMVYADGNILPHVTGLVGNASVDKYVYIHDGEKALTFSGSGNCYAVLPSFTNELNSLRLSFWSQMNNAKNGTLTLGYIKDGDINMNTFTAIETYTNNTNSMVQHTIDLSELPAEAKYLVFRWYHKSAAICSIDDIELRLLPQCRQVKEVAVSSDAMSSELMFAGGEAVDFDVLVVTKRLNPDTLTTTKFTAFRDTVDNDTVSLTGLAPMTTYYVYVRPVCDEEESIAWSNYVSFTTGCGLIPITRDNPWVENFDNRPLGSAGGDAPQCWEQIPQNSTSPYSYIYNSSNYVKSGSQSLYFGSSNTKAIYDILPIFDQPLNLLQIEFSYKHESADKSGTLSVGYVTDITDSTSFVPVLDCPMSTSWNTVEANFLSVPASVANTARIAFRYGASTASMAYWMGIDDITVSLIPTCHTIGAVSLMSATATSATLRFDPTNASQYQVVVSSKPINPATFNLASDTIVYNQLVSNTNPTISSLESNTRYYAYVRGYCGGDDYSTWSNELMFKTLCTAISLDAFGTEDFRDAGSVDCWTFGFTSPGSSTNNAYAERSSSNAYGAYLKLSKESVGAKNAAGVDTVYNDGAYAITPELAVEDIRNYQATFDAATTSTSADNYKRLNVGILVDPNDLSGMSVLKTIELHYAADSTALKTYTVSFANYEGDWMGTLGKYIIFQLNEPQKHDSTNFVLIDNVTIEPVANCEQVIEMVVDSLEGVWAAISWENTGAASYEVMLSAINTRRPDTLSAPLALDTVAETHKLFENLTGNTPYYAYVRAFCAEDTAKWSNALAFRTTQTPVVAPYADDFESDLQWLLVNGTQVNRWECGTAVHNGGTKSLYISNDNGLTNAYNDSTAAIVFATKYFRIEKTGTYTFQYDWKANGESSYDYLRVALVPATEELIAGTTPGQFGTTSLPSTWIALDGGAKLNQVTTWQTVTQDVKVPAGLYKVVFVWRNDLSRGTNPPVAIDNFSVDIVNCPKPAGLAATLTPGNGSIATLYWEKEGDEASKWVLEYAADSLFTNPMDTTVSDTTVDLSGLTPETLYYARLKAQCGDQAESEWGDVFTFRPTDAYFLLLNDSVKTSTYIPIYGYYAEQNTEGQFIIPASDLAALQWATITDLTFYAQEHNVAWGSAQFEVYMSEVPETTISALYDWSTLEKVKTIGSLSVENNEMAVHLSTPYQYSGGNLLIGFKEPVVGTYSTVNWYGKTAQGASMGGYGTSISQRNFLPKMLINYIPGVQPTCPKVSGIAVDHIDADSARIAVRNQGAAGYHFVVATAQIGIDSISATDLAKVIYNDSVMGDTVLHLNSLRPATPYYVYVRAICDGEHSVWSAPVAFISACMPISDMPYATSFENESVGDVPVCWNVLSSSASSSKYPSVAASYPHTGTKAFAWGVETSEDVLPPTTWVSLPEMEEDMSNLRLSFWYRSVPSYYICDSLIVGVMTNPNDSSTFVRLQGFRPTSTYQQAVIDLDAYTGIGKYIAFKRVVIGEEDYDYDWGYYTTYTPFVIDDVKVGLIPTCLPVEGVAVDSIGQNSAHISFHGTAGATYDVAVASAVLDMYHLSATDSALIAFSIDGTQDTAVIVSGLQPATTYYVYVRTHCADASVSEWTEAVSFATDCAPIAIDATGWTEDFENVVGSAASGSGVVPPCWEASATGTYVPHVANSGSYGYYVHSGSQSLSFYGEGYCYAMLPEFANALNELQISFYMQTESATYGALTLGYITADDNHMSTFKAIETYENHNGSMVLRETELSAVPDSAARLVFRWYYSSQWSCCIDDITVSLLPECKRVQNVAVGKIASTSAQLTFTLNDASEYVVLLTTKDINPDTLSTEALVAFRDTVSNDTVQISGLSASSTYYAYVRALCGEGLSSTWSASPSFDTECDAIVVAEGAPWTENFESYASGTFVANCWRNEHLSGAGSQLFSISTTSNGSNSTHQLRLPDMTSGTMTLLTLPVFQLDAVDGYTFTLDVYRNTTSYPEEGLRIFASNASTLDTAAVELAFISRNYQTASTSGTTEIPAESVSNWYTYELSIPLEGLVHIFVRGESRYGSSTYMDNFVVTKLPECREVKNLKASDITTSSAQIRFTKTPSPEYDFVVTTQAIKPDTLASVAASLIVYRDTIDTMVVALSALQPSTDYYVYVQGLCTDTTASEWASASFMTRCLEEVPYVMNFDNTSDRKPLKGSSTEMIPSCWEGGYSSSSYTSYIQNNTTSATYAYSAPSALRLYSGSSSNSYVVLPELNASLDTLQLTFKARAMYQGSTSMNNYATSTYAHSIKVGTMTNPDSISTFRLLETYVLDEVSSPTTSGDYWENVTIYLQGAKGKYIALVSEFDKANYVWIDNLEVSKAPDCIAPSGISVVAKTDGADVKWNSTAHRFEVALGQPGFTLPGGADTIFTVENAKALHISDLTSDTGYEFYVRAECAEDVFSDWSRVVSFTTSAGVPYADNFEEGNHWTLINGTCTNKWAWGSATSSTGSSSLYISDDNGASNQYTINSAAMVYATRQIYFEEGGYIFHYDWKAEGEVSSYGVYDYLRVALLPANVVIPQAGTSLPTGFSTSTLPTGWIALDDGALAGSSDWQNVTSSEIHLDAGTYTVVLAWRNDNSSGSNPPAAVDNFAIEKVACSAPGAPRIASVTQNSAVVRWNATAPAYDVAVLQAEDTIMTQYVAGKDSLVIENLSASTVYTVQLRAYCDEEEISRWSAPATFATECGVVSSYPWAENFDAITAVSGENVLPICWNYINTSTYSSYSYYPTVIEDGSYSTYSKSSPNALRFYSSYSSYSSYDPQDQYAILPQMSGLGNKRLTLYARAYSTSYDATFTVGVMTDPSNASTFVPVASFTPASTTYQKYVIPFYTYSGQGQYIAIKMEAANSTNTTRGVYIDDLEVEEMDLNCLGVKDLVASQVTENSVKLDFLFEDGLAHDAEVAISRESAYDPSTALQTQAISGNSYTFNIALQDQSTYYLYARQACGEGEYSAWEQITLKTHFSYIHEEEFTSTTLPEGWQRYTGLVDDVLAGAADLQSTTSGWSLTEATTAIDAIHFKGNIWGTSWKYWVVSPAITINAPADTIVALRFDAAYNKYNDLTTDPTIGDDDRFAVLVTTDDGQTWRKLSEWNNAGTGDHVLSEVPKEGQSQMISLTPYIGKSIRIAFYGESTASNADNDFHFGNIAITYATGKTFTAEICDGEDYVGTEPGNSFSIASDEYHIGENVYDKYILAPKGSGLPDSILVLHLTVHAMQTYEDSVTLCEGEAYADSVRGAYFNFTAQMGMTDRVAFVQNQYGCEDVVKLKVTVNPKQTVHIYDSIAQGDNYQWHGRVYMSATVAQFDTVSAVTGCDSTVYLHLSVYQKPVDPEDQAVENIYAQSLIIAPNPVKAGEPIHILNSFAAEALKEARIEIFSAAGALVYTQHGAEKPLILPGIPVSGLYTVRIIVGDEIFISSLLVH